MGRSRYKIYEPTHPHFITCTVLNWLPIFTNTESMSIILNSLKHLQKSDNLKIYAYVILENHLHLIVQSDDISKSIKNFNSFTAREIIKLLHQKNATTLLTQFSFYKRLIKKIEHIKYGKRGISQNLFKVII